MDDQTQDENTDVNQDEVNNEQPVQPAEAPAEQPTEEQPVKQAEEVQKPPYQPPVPQIDESKLPRNKDGTVNLNDVVGEVAKALRQDVSNTVLQTNQELETEKKAWEEATGKYPEIAKDKDLRDDVQGLREAAILRGQYYTPAQAAERILKRIGQSKEQGKQEAQESVRVQQSARVESASAPVDEGQQQLSDIQQRMGSRNAEDARAARQEWIKAQGFHNV